MKQQPPWTQDDMAEAASVWQDVIADIYGEDEHVPREARHTAFARIGLGIKRTASAVMVRFNLFGPSFGHGHGRGSTASAYALADLAARKEAECRRGLTGTIFGDPPPGYSALDRRTARANDAGVKRERGTA